VVLKNARIKHTVTESPAYRWGKWPDVPVTLKKGPQTLSFPWWSVFLPVDLNVRTRQRSRY
jgi:hypothetical protein